MSRRIVQLAALHRLEPIATDGSVSYGVSELFALDNNGVAWMMENPGTTLAKWARLPELPSIERRQNGFEIGPVSFATGGGEEP